MLPTQELGQHSTSLLLELYRYPYAQPLHVSEEIHPIHVPNYPCAIQMLSNMLVTNACECFSTRNICRSTARGVCITTRKYTWSEKKKTRLSYKTTSSFRLFTSLPNHLRIMNIRTILPLVALSLGKELALQHLMRLMIAAILWPLPLIPLIITIAASVLVLALSLSTTIGLLLLIVLLGLHLRLVGCSRILHLWRPCWCRIMLLGLGRKCKREGRKASWEGWGWRKCTPCCCLHVGDEGSDVQGHA